MESIAKCNRCGGTATGKTFDDAAYQINHAIGLASGIPCGAEYNQVFEVKTESPKKETTKDVPKKTNQTEISQKTKTRKHSITSKKQ